MPSDIKSLPTDDPRVLASAVGGFTVTPSDANNLNDGTDDVITRAVYVGTTGNIKVDMMDGSTITFNNVPVGMYSWRVKKVYATGSSPGTDIVALY